MVDVMLLGVAQDAGVPQAGCKCEHCSGVRKGVYEQQYVTSLAVIDREGKRSWLIDCSPDLKYQLNLLDQVAPDCPLQGILLTHLHMGHYTGLLQFGKEVMNTKKLPVYCTEAVQAFLQSNLPWSALIHDGNIVPTPIIPGETCKLTENVQLVPVSVNHRAEYSDTVAFFIQGPKKRVLYCPDIDSWERWDHNLHDVVMDVDLAFLDATFYSADELPGRDISQIPHPFITDTMSRVVGVEHKVVLIHMNHSNPVYLSTPERELCIDKGLNIGIQGQAWSL